MVARGEVRGRWEWRGLGRDGDKEKEMYPEIGHNQTKHVTKIHGVKEVCMSEKENRTSLFCLFTLRKKSPAPLLNAGRTIQEAESHLLAP